MKILLSQKKKSIIFSNLVIYLERRNPLTAKGAKVLRKDRRELENGFNFATFADLSTEASAEVDLAKSAVKMLFFMALIKSIIIWIAGISVLVLLFPLTFVIWLLVLPFDKNRVIIHWILIYQGMILSRIISFRKMDIEGREKIVKGTTYVIISNHQSILDTLLLYGIRYKFKWISKIENIKVPIMGWYLKMAGYIIVDRGNEESKAEMLQKSNTCLKNGISIMIFPEGTRSLNMEIGFFKRGAFQLAIQNGVPILPVVIDGTGRILPKHGLIFENGSPRIRVLEPILPSSFETTNPDDLALKITSFMSLQLKELRASEFTR